VLADLTLQRRADLAVEVLNQFLPPVIPGSYTYYKFSFTRGIASVNAGLKAGSPAAEPDTVTSLLDLFKELTSCAAEVDAGVEYTVGKDANRYILKFSFSVRMPEERALQREKAELSPVRGVKHSSMQPGES